MRQIDKRRLPIPTQKNESVYFLLDLPAHILPSRPWELGAADHRWKNRWHKTLAKSL